MSARIKLALGWMLLSLCDELAVFVPISLFVVWSVLIIRPMWFYHLVIHAYASKLARLEEETLQAVSTRDGEAEDWTPEATGEPTTRNEYDH